MVGGQVLPADNNFPAYPVGPQRNFGFRTMGPGLLQWQNSELFAESGPFPDHLFNFTGLLVAIFIQIVKKRFKM